MRLILFTVFTLFLSISFAQVDSYLESIDVTKNGVLQKPSKSRVDKLNDTAKDSLYSNYELAEEYGRIAYQMSYKMEYAEGEISALMNIGGAMLYSNREDSAMVYAKLALEIAERSSLEEAKIRCHSMIGSTHDYLGNYDDAAKSYFKAIEIAERVNPKLALIPYANLGRTFKTLNNLPKSREYSTKAYKAAIKHKDTNVIVASLNILGLIEKTEDNKDKALEHFEEGLQYARQINNLERQSHILYNMANIYFDKKEYEKGLKLHEESTEISKVNGSYLQSAIGYHSLAFTYWELKRYKEAAVIADSTMKYALKTTNYEMIMESYALQAAIAQSAKQYKKALEYLEIAYEYKDSLNYSRLNSSALEVEDDFKKQQKRFADSVEQVQRELKEANVKRVNDQKIKARETLLWIAGVVLIIILFGIYYLKKNNNLIKEQNNLVLKQKEEIQVQHQEITDSINYAKRIQDAIIGKTSEWQNISDEHFIFFKPRDVVSGDFYWAHHNKEKNLSVWAVADCTGHGVPGAFMSMLGIGFLNEIIIENGETDPGEILNLLRSKIIAALERKGQANSKDGMDISLCVWDKNANHLTYAGANNPLWIIRKGLIDDSVNVKRTTELTGVEYQLHELGADKMPIGYFLSSPPPFMTKSLQLKADDVVILFTDGFADQFGGDQGKKYKYKPLKELLLKLQSDEFKTITKSLEEEFTQWQGSEEQVDDLCIVGVKV